STVSDPNTIHNRHVFCEVEPCSGFCIIDSVHIRRTDERVGEKTSIPYVYSPFLMSAHQGDLVEDAITPDADGGARKDVCPHSNYTTPAHLKRALMPTKSDA